MLKARLYNGDGTPAVGFNDRIAQWLEGRLALREHKTPRAFEGLRKKYASELARLEEKGKNTWAAHRALLSNLTNIMFGIDVTTELRTRLSPELINPTGFRRTIDQGAAKNAGENFSNMIVWALADALRGQDEVLVDKGLPRFLQDVLTMQRRFRGVKYNRDLGLTIEGDLVVFSRDNPLNAIVVSGKTRLKEIFHVGTMWKLFFDMLDDKYCLRKWGLVRASKASLKDFLYVFATADMIPAGGRKTQGPDVEREFPRNLIALDASFFDYVFVSKEQIAHVANSLQFGAPREALFHDLGCLLDLVCQKFRIRLKG